MLLSCSVHGGICFKEILLKTIYPIVKIIILTTLSSIKVLLRYSFFITHHEVLTLYGFSPKDGSFKPIQKGNLRTMLNYLCDVPSGKQETESDLRSLRKSSIDHDNMKENSLKSSASDSHTTKKENEVVNNQFEFLNSETRNKKNCEASVRLVLERSKIVDLVFLFYL